MKIKVLILIAIGIIAIKAQSVLIIYTGATIEVSGSADICSDSLSGNVTGSGSFCSTPTEIESETLTEIPTIFALYQNYPNPLNPSTTISFSIPNEELVSLQVFNSLGEEVAELLYETKPAGNYSVSFDASELTSGVYFYKISAGDFIETKKMILMK